VSAAVPLQTAGAQALPIAGEPAPAPAGAATDSPVLLRPARPHDVPGITALLEDWARRGLVLPRTEASIYRHLREYVVAADASGVVGCAALRLYSPEVGEVCALAVAESRHGTGLGRRLVEAVMEGARDLGLRRLFALTLQEGFFARLGFERAAIAEFPGKLEQDCAGCLLRSRCAEVCVARDL